MKEKWMKLVPLAVLLVFFATIFVPRWINERSAMKFGEPLFAHELPADTTVISQDGAKSDDGSVLAAMLLKTNLTSDELEAFYSDINCEPAEEGQTVSVLAKALTEEDLDVLKQAKLYEEGASYQFVYLQSK